MINIDEHDHDTPTHSMNCPFDGCQYMVKIHAHDDEEALNNMADALYAHFEIAHEDYEIEAGELEDAIRENMTRVVI